MRSIVLERMSIRTSARARVRPRGEGHSNLSGTVFVISTGSVTFETDDSV